MKKSFITFAAALLIGSVSGTAIADEHGKKGTDPLQGQKTPLVKKGEPKDAQTLKKQGVMEEKGAVSKEEIVDPEHDTSHAVGSETGAKK